MHIVFLSRVEVQTFFAYDSDGYVRHMLRSPDLRARGARSIDHYLQIIHESADSFSPQEQALLSSMAEKAEDFLLKELGVECSQLPWKFGKTTGNVYENGLPHTRLDVIFLDFTSVKPSVSLLVHEKVHVYQRMYPKLARDWIKKHLDCAPASKRATHDMNLRSNPDLDEYSYVCNGQQLLSGRTYTSNNPKNIIDVRASDEYEHPYEAMAYILAARIV